MNKTFNFSFFTASLLFLFLLFSPPVHSEAVLEGAGILYGSSTGFVLGAPPGWIFDNSSGVNDGLYCVMYPKGSSWDTFRILIYGQIYGADGGSLEQYIKKNIKIIQKMSPDLKWKIGKKFKANGAYPAIIVDFAGFIDNSMERTAYLYYKDTILMVVMTTKVPGLMKKHRNAVDTILKVVSCMDVDDKTGK